MCSESLNFTGHHYEFHKLNGTVTVCTNSCCIRIFLINNLIIYFLWVTCILCCLFRHNIFTLE